MAEGPIRALTGRRRTRLTSTGCRNPWQPEPGRAPLIAAQAAVQTNGTTSVHPNHSPHRDFSQAPGGPGIVARSVVAKRPTRDREEAGSFMVNERLPEL